MHTYFGYTHIGTTSGHVQFIPGVGIYTVNDCFTPIYVKI